MSRASIKPHLQQLVLVLHQLPPDLLGRAAREGRQLRVYMRQRVCVHVLVCVCLCGGGERECMSLSKGRRACFCASVYVCVCVPLSLCPQTIDRRLLHVYTYLVQPDGRVQLQVVPQLAELQHLPHLLGEDDPLQAPVGGGGGGQAVAAPCLLIGWEEWV